MEMDMLHALIEVRRDYPGKVLCLEQIEDFDLNEPNEWRNTGSVIYERGHRPFSETGFAGAHFGTVIEDKGLW